MAIIQVVTEDGLADFDTTTQRVVAGPKAEPPQRCHCEREPAKLWLCCLVPGSDCLCEQRRRAAS